MGAVTNSYVVFVMPARLYELQDHFLPKGGYPVVGCDRLYSIYSVRGGLKPSYVDDTVERHSFTTMDEALAFVEVRLNERETEYRKRGIPIPQSLEEWWEGVANRTLFSVVKL